MHPTGVIMLSPKAPSATCPLNFVPPWAKSLSLTLSPLPVLRRNEKLRWSGIPTGVTFTGRVVP